MVRPTLGIYDLGKRAKFLFKMVLYYSWMQQNDPEYSCYGGPDIGQHMRIFPGKSQGGPGTEQVEQESEGTIGNRRYFDREG
jgi:hypothetical protein